MTTTLRILLIAAALAAATVPLPAAAGGSVVLPRFLSGDARCPHADQQSGSGRAAGHRRARAARGAGDRVLAASARDRDLVRALVSSVVSLVDAYRGRVAAVLRSLGPQLSARAARSEARVRPRRVTREAAIRLGGHAVREVNALHAAAHGHEARQAPSLESAFAAAQRMLGSERPAVPGVPKRSLLERYFRAAAIDGMTDPFFLEIILNPDTLPFERPFVLVHEWAHLAGYANEAEANFVAWLACTQGDAMARYSGWLAIFEHVAASLPRADRTALASSSEPDRGAICRPPLPDTRGPSPVVRTAARDVYDTYLRANRVHEGVASYTVVVRLMLGAGLEDGGRPRR